MVCNRNERTHGKGSPRMYKISWRALRNPEADNYTTLPEGMSHMAGRQTEIAAQPGNNPLVTTWKGASSTAKVSDFSKAY